MVGEGVKMKRFDKAFKVQAVKMVTEEGQKALRGSPFFGNPCQCAL